MGSTLDAPAPIFRWADVPYQRRQDSFDLELLAFSHHPDARQGVAGVRYTITDGVLVRELWALAITVSERYGDKLPVYRVTVAPELLDGFDAGLLRCDAEVYPWLGAPRSTDPGQTRSMAALGTAGYAPRAETPFVVAWDPLGTRYRPRFIYVDPASGTTTAASVVVSETAETAAAGPCALNIATALAAAYRADHALGAANGQPAQSRALDGFTVRLKAGVHGDMGATSVPTGLTSAETWGVIEGDPAFGDPRADVVLRTGRTTVLRASRMMLRNLRLETGGSAMSNSATNHWWLDNVEVRGKAGLETSATSPFSAPRGALYFSRVRYWRSGSSMRYSANQRPFLVRGCEASRRIEALVVVSSKWIAAIDPTASTLVETAVAGWYLPAPPDADRGCHEDAIVAGNDLRGLRRRAWNPASAPAMLYARPANAFQRKVFVNNVCERIGTNSEPLWSLGENTLSLATDLIIEGNSFVGERCNTLYSDPTPATLEETELLDNESYRNRVANNFFDWAPTKHDSFNDSTTQAIRTANGVADATGYRPHCLRSWPALYGVGFAANFEAGRHPGADNFRFMYFGVGSERSQAALQFTDDRSTYGSGTGSGDYAPGSDSALLGRCTVANVGVDQRGDGRGAAFAIGAIG